MHKDIDLDNSPLSERMKYFESKTNKRLFPDQPIIVRVDGKGFSRLVKRLGVERPYDSTISSCMGLGVEGVLETGAVLMAEFHSDEASFLLNGFQRTESEPYFGGKLQKLTSIIASIFTAHFNVGLQDCLYKHKHEREIAYFDARAFNLPLVDEVANYFLWRSRDCYRNAINDLARSQFSHKQLHEKTSLDKLNMIEPTSLEYALKNGGRMYGTFWCDNVGWQSVTDIVDFPTARGMVESSITKTE
jgi:tRNA(His) guanylyltransferase